MVISQKYHESLKRLADFVVGGCLFSVKVIQKISKMSVIFKRMYRSLCLDGLNWHIYLF